MESNWVKKEVVLAKDGKMDVEINELLSLVESNVKQVYVIILNLL